MKGAKSLRSPTPPGFDIAPSFDSLLRSCFGVHTRWDAFASPPAAMIDAPPAALLVVSLRSRWNDECRRPVFVLAGGGKQSGVRLRRPPLAIGGGGCLIAASDRGTDGDRGLGLGLAGGGGREWNDADFGAPRGGLRIQQLIS